MTELIELIAKTLVDNVEGVVVKKVEGESTVVYELQVEKSDVGKIIGKKGNTARAIRTILNAAGRKSGKRVMLEIIE
ncbi:MAG: KH domain-containing protein [Candidatus Delongbacteria bacterium]|nr:KH domain-containing protein [Candidatus Delongbacteria bacterium]